MKEFDLRAAVVVFQKLGVAAAYIHAWHQGSGKKDVESDRKIILHTLDEVRPALAKLPLSDLLQRQLGRLISRVPKSEEKELTLLVQEFYQNLMTEFDAPRFLMVSAEDRELYEQKEPPFGVDVATVFGDANRDISEASRCLSLDAWTASVFHLMRALELGLKKLAADVGLDPEAMSHENWKNIIDLIEAEIRKMEALQKSSEKVHRLKVLSSIAVQFRYFKDAWRNHVSHAH